MRDVRSLLPAEVAIASILAAGLWALQTRSWRQDSERRRFRRMISKTWQPRPISRTTPINGITRHTKTGERAMLNGLFGIERALKRKAPAADSGQQPGQGWVCVTSRT